MNPINRIKTFFKSSQIQHPLAEKNDGPTPNRECYSAYGEELLAQAWFEFNGYDLSTLTYLDIGAAHPFHLSNTYLFYRYGAKGVLVEPDPDQVEVLRQRRPLDTVVSAGISFDTQRGSAKLYQMNLPFFNTFSSTQAAYVLESSKGWKSEHQLTLIKEVDVPMIPIDEIIEEYMAGVAPDYLSIDVEGHDLDVLKSLDLERFKPKIICIEPSNKTHIFDEILIPHGYSLMAKTPDNALYMRF